LVDNITPLVVGATKDPTDKRKQIFSECVHVTMDNLFSGDEVLHYLGEGGWKGMMTCRCDCLHKAVPKNTSTTSRQHQSIQGPNWHNLKSQSLLLNMSSNQTVSNLTVTQRKNQRTTFFAMFHSNQLEEPTFPQLMHCLLLNYMCETAVREGDSRRGHGGLK
jgi:hypothetical protein